MKNYDEKMPSTYLQHLDANNLYGWEMSKTLPISDFKWTDDLSLYTEEFIKNYDVDGNIRCILEVDVEHPKLLWCLHRDLSFLSEKRKIFRLESDKVTKSVKLVTTLDDKENYVVLIATLQQSLNHGLKFKKVHRVIEFKQEAWMKSYIDLNIKLRTQAKNEFKKDFFKFMINSNFGKTMENVRNHRNIKLVTFDNRRSKLVSEQNYHSFQLFSENLMAILGQAILDRHQ